MTPYLLILCSFPVLTGLNFSHRRDYPFHQVVVPSRQRGDQREAKALGVGGRLSRDQWRRFCRAATRQRRQQHLVRRRELAFPGKRIDFRVRRHELFQRDRSGLVLAHTWNYGHLRWETKCLRPTQSGALCNALADGLPPGQRPPKRVSVISNSDRWIEASITGYWSISPLDLEPSDCCFTTPRLDEITAQTPQRRKSSY